MSGSQAVLAINVTNQQNKFTKCQESKCFTSIFLTKQKIQCTSEFICINQQIIAVLLACNTGVNQGEMVVVVLQGRVCV